MACSLGILPWKNEARRRCAAYCILGMPSLQPCGDPASRTWAAWGPAACESMSSGWDGPVALSAPRGPAWGEAGRCAVYGLTHLSRNCRDPGAAESGFHGCTKVYGGERVCWLTVRILRPMIG